MHSVSGCSNLQRDQQVRRYTKVYRSLTFYVNDSNKQDNINIQTVPVHCVNNFTINSMKFSTHSIMKCYAKILAETQRKVMNKPWWFNQWRSVNKYIRNGSNLQTTAYRIEIISQEETVSLHVFDWQKQSRTSTRSDIASVKPVSCGSVVSRTTASPKEEPDVKTPSSLRKAISLALPVMTFITVLLTDATCLYKQV